MDVGKTEYVVQREVLDNVRLDEVAHKGNWSTTPTTGERVKESFRCSVARLKLILVTYVPILGWLPRYPIRENGIGDLISGSSIAVMHLPLSLAYASLANLRPVFGLYSSFYPVVVYVIFGTSRHISVGTFAMTSMMVGTVVQKLAPDSNFLINSTNGTILNTEARDDYRVIVASSFSVLVGIVQMLLGVAGFGFLVSFLSEPLIRGYTTASAFQVGTTQLRYLFGVVPGLYSGILAVIYTWVDVCRLLPKTRPPEVVVSVLALFFLIVIKEINSYYRQKLPLPIPIELMLIIVATLATHFGGLNVKYGIDVVGVIPSGLRPPRAPDTSLFIQMVGEAFAVAVVGYTINISLAKIFGQKHGYRVNNNQDLRALGFSNAVGGCFQCFAVCSSMARSLVQETTGGRTQIAGLVSSIFILIAILKIGSLFEDLPKAILAAIVFVNLKEIFLQLADVPKLWRTDKVDMVVWIVTFLSTLLLNLDVGLAVSVGFSILVYIFRTQRPHYSILGLVPGTDLYLDIDIYREAKEIPGIKIFRSSLTMNYTNAEMYFEGLQEKSGIDFEKLQEAKKKEELALKYKQIKEKKKARKEAKKQKKALGNLSNDPFSFSVDQSQENYLSPIESSKNSISIGQVNRAYQDDTTIYKSNADLGFNGDDSINTVLREKKEKAFALDTHSIILDLSTTNFVDTVCVTTLKNIFRDLGQIDLNVYLAGCQTNVVERMEAAKFFSDSISKSQLFVTVHDAVLHILKQTQSDRAHVGCFHSR